MEIDDKPIPVIPTKRNVRRSVAIAWRNDFEKLYPGIDLFILRDLSRADNYHCGRCMSIEYGHFEFADGVCIPKENHTIAMLPKI